MKRYLSIWLPDWPVERLYRKARNKTDNMLADITPETAFAFTVSAPGGIRVIAMNKAAKKAGVRKNQLLTNAKALCPRIRIFESTPQEDREELEQLALWSIRYSPWVSAYPPDGIIINITGCAHLLGGEAALVKDISTRLSRFGFKAYISIADTIGAASATSRFGNNPGKIVEQGKTKNAIEKLPLAALRIDRETIERLSRVGLKTIGALSNKPRAPLAARYGKTLLTRLDQIVGKTSESLSPIAEPPDYRVQKKFLEPVLLVEQIFFSFDELAISITDMLECSGLGARQFILFLFRVDGNVKWLEIRTSRLTSNASHITRLLNEKFSILCEDYDAGFGIEKVILGAYHTEVKPSRQISINSKRENVSSTEFQTLIDRYGNRLGFQNIGRFIPRESHIPERSEQLIPISEENKKPLNWKGFCNNLQGGSHLGRPALLLPRPEPVTAIAEVPDGPPVHFEWRRLKYRIVRAEGPERLSPEWWHSTTGIYEPTRDYFRVEDTDGGRFWLFRQGLYEHEKTPTWFMHGFFA